jgi:hypothetical protein
MRGVLIVDVADGDGFRDSFRRFLKLFKKQIYFLTRLEISILLRS